MGGARMVDTKIANCDGQARGIRADGKQPNGLGGENLGGRRKSVSEQQDNCEPISEITSDQHKLEKTIENEDSQRTSSNIKKQLILSIGNDCTQAAAASFDNSPIHKHHHHQSTNKNDAQQKEEVMQYGDERRARSNGDGRKYSVKYSEPSKSAQSLTLTTTTSSEAIKPSRKRYFILFMFVILQMIKSFQWICLAGITNVVANFYNVDNLAINWTTILFMVTFLVLALPVSWLMDAIGLRRSVLIGSLGVTLGVLIKCFSCHRAGFPLSMLGHLIIGLAEPFFFSSYAQLASIWFPDHQVALATAASLVGEQLGLALGFIIPPLMIGNDSQDFEAIETGLSRLFQAMACICLLNTLSIVICFDEKPRFAPGFARHKQISEEKLRRQSCSINIATSPAQTTNNSITNQQTNGQQPRQSSTSVSSVARQPNFIARGRRFSRRLSQNLGEQVKLSSKFVTHKHFILLMIGFGIIEGVSYSLHTLLNQMIIRPRELSSPDSWTPHINNDNQTTTTKEEDAVNLIVVGNTGLILIIAGLFGSSLCGFLLDRYHRYKLTTASIYLLGLISMGALTSCLLLNEPLLLYLASAPLGFALTGYASCGFDYGVEITYPKPELLSSTLLNLSAQLFGIPISLAGSLIVDQCGNQALGAFFGVIMLLGFVVTLLQGGALRRQQAIEHQRQQLQNGDQKPQLTNKS